MTVSWLTATNNQGRFVMSINQHRYTANYMQHVGQEFCLCVPVAGMESLIVAVGGVSGRVGSKFVDTCTNTEDNNHSTSTTEQCSKPTESQQRQQQQQQCSEKDKPFATTGNNNVSKRQRKRFERETLRHGIPGLVRIPFGLPPPCLDKDEKNHDTDLFCIQGTVAHLRCKSYMVNNQDVDDGHYLIFAQVLDAYCHPDYWNPTKKIFCSKQGQEPILTFLGSQRFGYVTSDETS